MKKGQNTRGYASYIACDIHREYILVGGQNEDQAWSHRAGLVSTSFRNGLGRIFVRVTSSFWKRRPMCGRPMMSLFGW